jgi:hypothetical protein
VLLEQGLASEVTIRRCGTAQGRSNARGFGDSRTVGINLAGAMVSSLSPNVNLVGDRAAARRHGGDRHEDDDLGGQG